MGPENVRFHLFGTIMAMVKIAEKPKIANVDPDEVLLDQAVC